MQWRISIYLVVVHATQRKDSIGLQCNSLPTLYFNPGNLPLLELNRQAQKYSSRWLGFHQLLYFRQLQKTVLLEGTVKESFNTQDRNGHFKSSQDEDTFQEVIEATSLQSPTNQLQLATNILHFQRKKVVHFKLFKLNEWP